MVIALFGGTFDPIHKAHERAVELALKHADKLIVLPNNISPFKERGENAQHRTNMLNLVFNSCENVRVDTFEQERSGKSYTVDTLEHFAKIYPPKENKLAFVLGSDSFFDIFDWRGYDKIAKLCTLYIVLRQGSNDSLKLETALKKWNTLGSTAEIIGECGEISSTDIRIDLEFGFKPKELDNAVFEYIEKNKLYKDYEKYTTALKHYLTDKEKYTHTVNVCKTALSLVKRWGGDSEKVMLATILHDIGKNIDIEGAIELGLCIQERLEDIHPKCRHGYIGASIAEQKLGIRDADILNAIKHHTTGRADMSLIEKLTALADYIEPNREFKGITELREIAYQNLDEAMLIMYQNTINYLKAKNAMIDKRTMDALEFFKKQVRNAD